MRMPNKRCRKCGKMKPLEQFHHHHKSRDGRTHSCKKCKPRKPSWPSVEFRNPNYKPDKPERSSKPKSNGELLKINQELIEVCQGYQTEISRLTETIDSQKQAMNTQAKKLERYLFDEQKKITKTLKDDLIRQREARRDR